MFSAFHYDVSVYGMPEHLDVGICFIVFQPIKTSESKKNKNKNLPPDHKISEKRKLTIYFFFYLAYAVLIFKSTHKSNNSKK